MDRNIQMFYDFLLILTKNSELEKVFSNSLFFVLLFQQPPIFSRFLLNLTNIFPRNFTNH